MVQWTAGNRLLASGGWRLAAPAAMGRSFCSLFPVPCSLFPDQPYTGNFAVICATFPRTFAMADPSRGCS
ncbi:MAG: hypothetical protein OEX23_02145, partial [Betaproteobacteria bacterium]|nr:hypothetical protein [Betaproteobacteria bacterium]